jgi:hypothetical protein
MNFVVVLAAALMLISGAAPAAQDCDVPPSFTSSDNDLVHVMQAMKQRHRLEIAVVGTGSSALPGLDGARFAYPARLEAKLNQMFPESKIKVTAFVKSRQTAADAVATLKTVLAGSKPSLVIWQTGTVDAVLGVEPDEFNATLSAGVEAINAAAADVILIDMQYSPRTASMLNVSAYADVMRWVAQDSDAVLFDRMELMRHWDEAGTFDLYAATRKYDMARQVHDCIGRALASLIVNAAHLTPMRMQITR